jgi:hypothetical protein
MKTDEALAVGERIVSMLKEHNYSAEQGVGGMVGAITKTCLTQKDPVGALNSIKESLDQCFQRAKELEKGHYLNLKFFDE